MNHELKLNINYDPAILTGLDKLVKNGYLTEEEKRQCIESNSFSFDLLVIIKNRIEIDHTPRAKCKSDQSRILNGFSIVELLN